MKAWQDEFPDLVEKFVMMEKNMAVDVNSFKSVIMAGLGSPNGIEATLTQMDKLFGASHQYDVSKDETVIERADGQTMRLTRYDFEDDYNRSIQKIVTWLTDNKAPIIAGGGGGGGYAPAVIPTTFISGANPKSIIMDEIAITTQKFSENEVARIGDLKRRAKSLISQMLQFQGSFFGMILINRFVLAGGCFTSWYHGESPKDHDVFILGWNGNKLEPDVWPEERYKLSDANYLNAINHKAKIVDVILDKQTKIQYIFTQYATREELMKSFDVEHACVSYTPHDDKLYISPLTFDCIKNKKLMAHNGDIKSVAAWRLHKFREKGFKL